MKRVVYALVCLILLICPEVFAAKIRNDNVSVRTHAGAFYPVVTILNSGDEVRELESRGSWKKVETGDGKIGWIGVNAFNAVEKRIDYGAMAADTSERKMSQVMITAAVKGFFKNRITDPALNRELFENPFVKQVDPQGYESFKKETFRKRWSHRRFMEENRIKHQRAFVIDEKLVAVSAYIVGRLSAPGLSVDPEKTEYVNNVAQLVMESSEFYDLPVSVHIVETPRIFANATPIGVIVISRGMLDVIQSENELASLLGHEIAHVTLGHGALETHIRRPKIAAEDAFAEMADELGVDDVERELDEMSLDMYERAIRGRTQGYEAEADRRGMLYARRAGYDASGMASLLERLKGKIPASAGPEDSSHWIPFNIESRLMKIKKYLETDLKPEKRYRSFESRYVRQMGRPDRSLSSMK